MAHVIAAIILFVLSIIAHMAFCRFKRIKDIAIGPLLCCCACGGGLYLVLCLSLLPPSGPGGLPLSGGVLFCALVPFYVSFYHSTVVNSPTRIMIDACTLLPRTKEELLEVCCQADFASTRLEALVAHGIIRREGSMLTATGRGKMIAGVLDLYQRTVGRPKGG